MRLIRGFSVFFGVKTGLNRRKGIFFTYHGNKTALAAVIIKTLLKNQAS